MDRYGYVNGLLGAPWKANGKSSEGWDCYHLARHVEKELFGRDVPLINLPADPTWGWMIKTIREHPENKFWRQTESAHGIVRARDGALVLMARSKSPAHIGVWFAPERRILHADQDEGVVFDDMATLRAKLWKRLIYMEPIT